MIITCPHCATRYQVAREAIGPAGRKVQCAQCARDWQETLAAPPEDEDRLFASDREARLDAEMEAEERAAIAAAPPAFPRAVPAIPAPAAGSVPPTPSDNLLDEDEHQRLQRAFNRRRNRLGRSMPHAKLRRGLRLFVLIALIAIPSGAVMARNDIVSRYPSLAGLYGAIGMPINVVGLEFHTIETSHAIIAGQSVLSVSAEIVGISPGIVPVPAVLVSLLDEAGASLYQWRVTAPVATLMSGEVAPLETRLADPPAEARTVRLSFSTDTRGSIAPDRS